MQSMNFSKLRRDLDEAITFAQLDVASNLAQQGLRAAQACENLGEIGYFRAQQFIIDENYEAAIEHLHFAIQHNPSDGAAYNDLALCTIELGGSIMDALNYFDKGIAVEPDYASVYHNKGWYLNQLNRSHEAIGYLKKALELEPNRAVTYENLADAYFNLGIIQGAITAYNQALKMIKSSHTDIREQIEAKIKMLIDQTSH